MTLDPNLIQDMLNAMDRNRKIINDDIASLVYYFQGGLDFNDAWLLTADQRKRMAKIVEKHFENMSGNKNQKLI